MVQTQLESIYLKVARKKAVNLVVCDRGLLDGAAYYSGVTKNFLQFNNTSLEKIYKRYDAVIWLETLVKIDKNKSIEIRNLDKKDISLALKISNNNLENWRSHHNFYKVKSSSIGDKKKSIINIINDLLTN